MTARDTTSKGPPRSSGGPLVEMLRLLRVAIELARLYAPEEREQLRSTGSDDHVTVVALAKQNLVAVFGELKAVAL